MASLTTRVLLKLTLIVTAGAFVQVQTASAEKLTQREHGQTQQSHSQPKIAIVGAGIGGAFTAYNLRQLFNDSVELHM